MGGVGAFVLPANGYNDFERAMRQKFVIEISGLTPLRRYAAPQLVDKRLLAVDGLVEPERAIFAFKVQQLR